MTTQQDVTVEDIGEQWGRLASQLFGQAIYLRRQLEALQMENNRLKVENEQFRQKIDEAKRAVATIRQRNGVNEKSRPLAGGQVAYNE